MSNRSVFMDDVNRNINKMHIYNMQFIVSVLWMIFSLTLLYIDLDVDASDHQKKMLELWSMCSMLISLVLLDVCLFFRILTIAPFLFISSVYIYNYASRCKYAYMLLMSGIVTWLHATVYVCDIIILVTRYILQHQSPSTFTDSSSLA